MDIQTVIDKQMIRELQNSYSYAMDAGRYDDLDALFLPEANYDFGPAGSASSLVEIKQVIREALEPLTAVQHINGNPWAEVVGDEASAGCYLRVHMHREGATDGEHFEMGGQYTDELVRTPHGWRFARRTIKILWSQGNPNVRWDR